MVAVRLAALCAGSPAPAPAPMRMEVTACAITLRVRSAARSVAFYESCLGLNAQPAADEADPARRRRSAYADAPRARARGRDAAARRGPDVRPPPPGPAPAGAGAGGRAGGRRGVPRGAGPLFDEEDGCLGLALRVPGDGSRDSVEAAGAVGDPGRTARCSCARSRTSTPAR